MAKKTPVKKSRRGLKRSVRRSLAAVLMITAIAVAAIPVPENYAAPEEEGRDDSPVTLPYSYPVDEKGNSTLPSLVKKDFLSTTLEDKDLTTAYTINALSDGTYQMDWQFRFYVTTVGGNRRGIIKTYNSSYAQERVVLKPNITCDYATVTNEKFLEYFSEKYHKDNNTGLYSYKVTNPATASSSATEYLDDLFFKEWFKDEYQTYSSGYTAAYEEYQKKLEEWNNGSEDTRGDKPTEPVFAKTLADLTLDQQCKFYCDHAENGKYAGCKLAVVIDSSKTGADGKNVRVFIPQKLPDGNPSATLMFDDQLFVYTTDATIIGIGDGAFKDTHNVLYLTVPDEIKYIGKSAFENSFLKEIDLVNLEEICDAAFKNCSDLTSVTIGSGATRIGTECFYGTDITSITFPSSVSEIGPGAFAECHFLQKIDFSAISGRDIVIREYAFYNALALNEVIVMRSGDTEAGVNITTLGKCAFAVDGIVTGNMADFTFPTALSGAAAGVGEVGLGDFVLAGRTNLLRVVMPSSFGANLPAKVPDGTFYNCFNLEYVRFPDTCGRASYTPGNTATTRGNGLFSTVSNPDFYVWGPELDSLTRDPATPRRTTWDAVTAVSEKVPYRYDRGEQQFYEISDGIYLLCIDNNGVLTSCTRKDKNTPLGDTLIDLEIPAKVGETEVTGIASNCFSDDELNQHVKSVKIEDDSKLATINDGVFMGWKQLKKVYIGNSVTSIGNNAFKDCSRLIDVTFSSPKNGHEAFTVGTDAFNTQSPELTFHGDIVDGYAPFEWAMDPSNVIEAKNGLRVCYKSLAPTYLTVMYNPITKMVTLLDYPKYSEIDSILQEQFADEIKTAGCKTYTEWREKTLYNETFGTAAYEGSRERFAIAWQAALSAADPEAVEAAKAEVYANRELYGPWVNPDFCKGGWKAYLSTSGTTSEDSTDSGSLGTRVSDFLFKPIVAYAADENPTPYYTANPYNVTYAVNGKDNFFMPTTEESGLVYYTTNIEIPAGVESIDVFGFVKDYTADGEEYTATDDSNIANYNTYLYNSWDSLSRDMYERQFAEDEDNIRSVPGLFSGFYDDVKASVPEERKRGNDVIRSVTMYTVKYLPNYAFDSCEGLNYVILGSECSDIGKAPFRGCYALTTVGNNDYYTTDNGIIYSHNTDGSLTIEECLSGRGNVVGAGTINALFDPNLSSVSVIKPGAFEDCDYVSEVNFGSNDTAGLTEIPEDCFRNCDLLSKVTLPMTVNDVGPNSFVGANSLNELVVYGKEVKISGRAFRNNKVNNKPERTRTTVRTYTDSAVVRYVKEYGDEYNLVLDEVRPLGEIWQVSFYDGNYTLIEELKDRDGNILDNPQYVEDGDRPTEPVAPEMEGWTFDRWVGSNNVKLGDAIHEDTSFYAQGFSESGMVGGKYPVTFWDGIDGQQVGPTQYIDPGSDAIAPAHPVHAGYEADGYSDTYTDVQSPKTIIMKYKVSGTSGGSTSGTSSNNSSNTGNSGTSSSTSSSSTSTSSTTSGSGSEVGKYTVTVENGSGSGSYDVGSTVIIAANTAPAGMVFKNWTTESNGVALASVSMTATTFTMPANNVTVTANYVTATANAVNTGSTGSVGNTGNTGNNSNGSTRVDITKPGISNKDLATANTNGSTDNFVVKITETDEATRAVAEALTNKYGSLENILYYAMDISLYDSTGTVKISDTSGLSVDITIPIPDALVAYGGNNKAGAVINGNQLENLNENFTTINGVPCIRFTATHFSPYTIYVDTGNLTEGMLDVTPKTGDPIHPKWFLSIGLACLSVILFMKKDKVVKVKTA